MMKVVKRCTFLMLILLILAVVMPAAALQASAETIVNGVCGDHLTWTVDDRGVLKISGSGEMYDYDTWYPMPPWIGYSFDKVIISDGVTYVGKDAFPWGYSINSVTLPETLVSIGESAFSSLNISSVTLPKSLRHIGAEAFSSCGKLSSVKLQEGLISIGDQAFASCSALTSVKIPASVTEIGDSAFFGCTELEKISIASGSGSYISSDGILYNKKKTQLIFCPTNKTGSFTVPKSVTEIADTAFAGCAGLKSIKLPENITRIGVGAFYQCTALSSVNIPASVTQISDSAFFECTALSSVSIPASVTQIGEAAFSGCSGISAISISENVSAIGAQAFYECIGLTSISFPKELTSIGDEAFYGCTGLKSVSLPKKLTAIGKGAFYGCAGLKSVSLPKKLTTIGKSAFYGCSSLTSIVIPENVIDIGEKAFTNIESLEKITVDADNPAYSSVDNILYDKKQTMVLQCPETRRGAVKIPKTVTAIGASAFADCFGLTSITIPERVTSIGESAFSGCISLTSVTIPEKVSIIRQNTFEYCVGLKSIRIPENVTLIEHYAFQYCSGLEDIIFPASVTSIGEMAFRGTELHAVVFEGNAPEALLDGNPFGDYGPFTGEFATAYYPEGNETWTESAIAQLNLTSNLVWESYALGEIPWATPLWIYTQPKTQYVALGEKAKFTVKASGDDLTYQWYYKDADGKAYKKCSGTKATYSLELTEARKDRKLYCIVTDKYGNEAKSKTVYMRMAASIKTEPKTQYVQLGEKSKIKVKAVGDGLTYQWYYKDAGTSKYKKSSITSATYSAEMTEARKDRKVYCVIKDKYGNEVKSKTVTLRMAASIKTEPKSVKTSIGKKATFTVKALGDDLKYQWYYKDTDGKKYKKASCTKATYSIELTKARNGRKFYCVVTDKYGNEVKTKTVSMKKK